MHKNAPINEAFDAELARWTKYQNCSEALLGELNPSMRDLVTNTLFCPPAYHSFVSERVEAAVEDDDDEMEILEETVEQVINEAQGDDAVTTDSFYNETGSIPLVDLLKDANNTGNLTTEMLLAMAKHSCMMVRGSLGQQTSIKPDNLQGLDANVLLGALRPQLESPHSIEALAAADLMLRLGADPGEVDAMWKTWPAPERMHLAFPMISLYDSDIAYEYLGSLVGTEDFEDVAWELRELATPKALTVLVAAQEQVRGDMVSNYVCQVACIEVPGAAAALQTLAESASEAMKQEARAWQVRIQQRDAGVEEWVTLPTSAPTLPEDILVQGDKHPKAEYAMSGGANCIVCHEAIAPGALCLGVLRVLEAATATSSNESTEWVHLQCWEGSPELQLVQDLDASLRETSPDIWTKNRFPLFGLVSPSEWSVFTDWLEAQDGECEHDEESYNEWFSTKGLDKSTVAQKSEKLYEVMGRIAGTGACACAAAEGVLLYPFPDPV